jgi:hypothetical protein
LADVVSPTSACGSILCRRQHSGTENASLDSQGVKDVLLGRAQYEARHPNVDFSLWVASNQFFNDTACERARKSGVSVVNQKDIERLLKQHAVTDADLLRFLYAYWDDAA